MPFSQLLIPPRRETIEMIDAHDPDVSDFAQAFTDVARINRYLGGTRAVVRHLIPLLQLCPKDRPARILDVATGSADIPRHLVRLSEQGRLPRKLEIVATDNHPKMLDLAQKWTPVSAFPSIRIEEADALNLSYADSNFDIALCSLSFHHLGWENCLRALQEMERVTTVGFIVNDLLRDRLAYSGIWILTRLLNAHRFTRHDAPASVLRSYSRREYEAMAREAGIACTIYTEPMYRALLVHLRNEPM